MDYLCRLDQLARAVQRMRELQTTSKIGHEVIDNVMRQAAEAIVDALIARTLGIILPSVPPAPTDQLYTRSAAALRDVLPDVPPPPARGLPDLSTLLMQWKPDEQESK